MSSKINDDYSLEELEGDYWPLGKSFPTKLVEDVFMLRRQKLKNLDDGDIRVLLSQNVGLKYLIPKALLILEKDFFCEASYYPGDLFETLLRIDQSYWIKNLCEKRKFISLIKTNFTKENIQIAEYDHNEEIHNLIEQLLTLN